MSMDTVPFDAVRIAGALDLSPVGDAIHPRRLPAWTRPQLVDPALDLLVGIPAGVRVELVTDASALELDVNATMLQLGDADLIPAVFDLVVDGAMTQRVSTTEGTKILVDPATGAIEFVPGGPTTVRFDLPGSGSRRVSVWLPHAASIDLLALRVSPGASVAAAAPVGPVWAHHGSSISHCLEALGPTGTWPATAAALGGLDLVGLGLAGQCMLDPFVARTMRDLPADVLSLKVGINIVNGDTFRERTFVPALHGFLDTVREGHPTTPFVLVSPILCPPAEDHPGPTPSVDGKCTVVERPAALAFGALTLRRIRELIVSVIAARGDANLHYLDGLSLFGADDVGDLPDLLHPNQAGYTRMGERFNAAVFAEGGLVPVASLMA